MPRSPKSDLATLARTAKDQLRRAELLGTSLDIRLKTGMREASKEDRSWSPDDSWRSDFNTVTTTISQVGQALQRALEANQKRLGGMTIDQLEAQFKAEMMRAAGSFTVEDWQILDRIRMKQVLKA